MKSTRPLWLSIFMVLFLVAASLVGFATGYLKPVLGLDLEGGIAVILSAPDGTANDVMQQARANIANRVDAFGVGEPSIVVSGNTIEIQIPGLSNSHVEQRSADLYCLIGANGDSYGCSKDQATASLALKGLSVDSVPTKVCLIGGDGTQLSCYGTQEEATSAQGLISTQPKTSPTPSASTSPTASPSGAGPSPAASAYCLTDSTGKELACYGSRAQAEKVRTGITTKVTETSWCFVAPGNAASASATPTPSASASPSKKAKASATPSASASPSPTPETAYASLDTSAAQPLPCSFATKSEAQTALDAVAAQHVTTQYCVVSSQNQDLGCYTSTAAADQQQRATGQQRLLDIIGKTARLEERPTLQIVPPSSSQYAGIAVTCGTPQEQASKACQGSAQDQNTVWYLDKSQNKVQLGPVVITGANITKATAQLTGGTQTNPLTQWAVAFQLDSEGSKAFATATTTALTLPAPQNQIAIAVDRTIVSNPVVQGAITTGSGEITGNFTEQQAKDLATVLQAGALPVELTRQSVQTVSPTLGSESLKEGIIAGLAGLILLFLYLLLYYRLLGIVAWFGMTIWAILAIALISLAGKSFGYALTLAGVAGLVISLGVTADSYIVFFERLKDELRGGKAARTAIQPAFKRAFRTIVAADIVTGIAAAVLYLTAVSSVRGFALTLGVATLLDLFVVYFFKRPTVFLIARNQRLVEMPGFGLTSATAGDHVAVDTSGEAPA
ncbi:MAG: protein translocase subunit SecD [Actinomycetota bacterium]